MVRAVIQLEVALDLSKRSSGEQDQKGVICTMKLAHLHIKMDSKA